MAAVKTIMKSVCTSTALLFGVLVFLWLVNALVTRWNNRKINEFMALIPGPTPIPFIGTMYVFLGKSENLCKFLLNHFKKYPKVVAHRWFGGQAVLLTGDLEITNALLSSPHNIEKTPDYKVLENGSNGIVTYSGYQWRLTRNVLTPGFKTNIEGASFSDNYTHHLRTFLDILDKYTDGKYHDLFPIICACTLDLVNDNYGETRVDAQRKRTDYSRLLVTATDMIHERLFNPLLRPDWLYSLLGKQDKLKKITVVGETLIREIIEQRSAIRKQWKEQNPTSERPQTGIEVLLSNVDSGIILKEDAVGIALDIVLAGCVLPGAVLTGTFWLLSRSPEIQKKAYQEILDTCTGDEVTLDDLPKLVYVEMIVKEALRHFTIPFVARELVEDLKVNHKMTIPAGIRVLLATYVLHHDPEFWEKPNEFYPEHFSEDNEKSRPKGAYVPFLSGSRNCLGQPYAMQLMTMFVANTLLHYEFSSNKKPPQDLSKEKYQVLFVLLPKEHKVQIKKRQRKIRGGSS